MAPPSKRKLEKEDDTDTNEVASDSVVRASKRVNKTAVPEQESVVVHTGSQVASNSSDENVTQDPRASKSILDQSFVLRVVPRGTAPDEVLDGVAVSSHDDTQSIAESPDLSMPPGLKSDTGSDVPFNVPSTTKASFDTVPEELVVGIFNLLRGDSGSLYKISLVNRRWRRIALEPLYSIFCSEDILFHAGEDDRISAGRAFVRSIVTDTDLAQKVQKLTWSYNINTAVHDASNLRKYEPRGQELKVFWAWLAELQFPGSGFIMVWMEKLRRSHREVNQLSIAMLRSTNLRELTVYDESIAPEYQPNDLQWINILKNAARGRPKGLLPKFEHLRSIELHVRGAHFRISTLSCILRLPSLRKFLLSGAIETAPIPALAWECPDSASGVEHLVLSQCFFDSRVISQVLSSVKALKHFEYAYDSANWEPLTFGDPNVSNWAQHSWKIIRDALEEHKDTLEVLKLEDNSDPEIVEVLHVFIWDNESLGSLREFHKLREIEVPIVALTGSDHGHSDGACNSRKHPVANLPRGTRTVKLTFENAAGLPTDYTMPIYELKKGVSDRTFSDLRQVCLHVKDDEDSVSLQQELQGPVQDLRNVGIDVDVVWAEDCISLD